MLPSAVAKRTFHSFNEDNLLSRAAELGYYFLFALFPTLLSASAIFGLVVRSGDLYLKLLNYLALIVPPDAFKIVLETFNQTTTHSSGGKLIFGLAAALWSASVGFSAIQDTLNIVYKVRETRPYWKVKGAAILVTVLLSLLVVITLSTILFGGVAAAWLGHHLHPSPLAFVAVWGTRICMWGLAISLSILIFAVIYYFAPDVPKKKWRWFTPGRRRRHLRLGSRLGHPARVPPLLQHLLRYLRFAGRGHHPPDLVLHHGTDAPDRRRDQLRN